MKRILILLLGLGFGGFQVLNGQDHKQLSGSYYKTHFVEMTNDLESRYDLQFFFKPELDSIKITLSFVEFSLREVLDQITDISKVQFLVKGDNIVVATDRFIVNSQLDSAFFDLQPNGGQVKVKEGGSILDIIKEVADLDKGQLLENKVIEIGDVTKRFNSEPATISGYVSEALTGEPAIGASVYIKKPQLVGVTTDQFGYFSFTLPRGEHDLFVNYTGMRLLKRQIILFSDGKINLELEDDIISLKEVVVTGDRDIIDDLQTGFASLNIKSIKQIPSIMGEADIMKIALTLPGVQTVSEGAAGFNVRGGSADQNLVLLNDTPVYNTNHLFGFFSVFNSDVLSGASLYKSGIGVNYGGRISSVFDVTLREGNKKKFTLKGGISPLTAKVTIEGPIKKDTSSYIIGVRSTYSDWVFSLLDDPNLRNSSGAFSDIVGKTSFSIDDKNKLIISAYHSRDNFKLNSDSLYRYFNSNANMQWAHTFSNKLNAFFSLSFANYNYELSSDLNLSKAFKLKYNINHYSLKTEFNYSHKEKGLAKFGVSSTLYKLQPGSKNPIGSMSIVAPINLIEEQGLETAVYSGYEYELNNRMSVYGGIRISMFNSLGSSQSFSYLSSQPKEVEFIIDTTYYSNGKVIKTYINPELRLSARYKLKKNLSLKFSFDNTTQYIHILSNTTSISPIDTWRLSSQNLSPQIGNQYSIGLYHNIPRTTLGISLEAYYKRVKNTLEYKDGASLLLNEALETDVIRAQNKSFGVELLLKKNLGKFSGWLSYTYARSLIKVNGDFDIERINSGQYYPSNYDKPHSMVLVSNFKFNRRINISLNMTYSTGRPTTFPQGKYVFKNQPILLYTERNRLRIPDYFRTDLSFNIEGNHKVHKKIHGSWSFSIYNLTGRSNPYSIFFRSEQGKIKGYKISIFKNAIPTLTYHFQLR